MAWKGTPELDKSDFQAGLDELLLSISSVTTYNLAREALDLLCKRKDGFDIVISNINMPDVDGFRLLEHVGLEMDLPVIIIFNERQAVMKNVQDGACDYLGREAQTCGEIILQMALISGEGGSNMWGK